MGRLFQYNRFNEGNDKQDNISKNIMNKNSKNDQIIKICPAYSELYPEYNEDKTSAATTTLEPPLITATTPTSATTKRLDLAIRKYQQWSCKFLPTSTTTTTTTTKSGNSLTDCIPTLPKIASSNLTLKATTTATTASDYENLENDRQLLVNDTKKSKVYDIMKEFLRRKVFQQQQQQKIEEHDDAVNQQQTEVDEDITSDYDEVDILESSYNADGEDTTDCCSDSTSPFEDEEVKSNLSDDELTTPTSKNQLKSKTNNPRKSLLSLSCWQSSQNCSDSTTEEEIEVKTETAYEDSDAGISDCCQLVNGKASPKRQKSPNYIRRVKQRKQQQQQQSKNRYNVNNAELSELLETSWYQPRITTKAALERLQLAQPGSFLVRRKTRTYELCLRGTNKVKCYTVINCADYYQLKGAKKQFTSLKALVTHHSVMAEQLPLTLLLPREKQKSKLTSQHYSDDFDTFESLYILGALKNLQAKTFEQ